MRSFENDKPGYYKKKKKKKKLKEYINLKI